MREPELTFRAAVNPSLEASSETSVFRTTRPMSSRSRLARSACGSAYRFAAAEVV